MQALSPPLFNTALTHVPNANSLRLSSTYAPSFPEPLPKSQSRRSRNDPARSSFDAAMGARHPFLSCKHWLLCNAEAPTVCLSNEEKEFQSQRQVIWHATFHPRMPTTVALHSTSWVERKSRSYVPLSCPRSIPFLSCPFNIFFFRLLESILLPSRYRRIILTEIQVRLKNE